MKNSHRYIFLIFFLFFFCFYNAQTRAIDSLKQLLREAKHDSSKVIYLNKLGSRMMYDNPDTGVIMAKQALQMAKNLNWPKGIGNSYGQLGTSHALKADYSNALDFYLKALKIDEEMKDDDRILGRLNNISIVYFDVRDYLKALEYLERCLKMAEARGDTDAVGRALGNIGNNYEALEQYDKALDFHFRSLKTAELLKNTNRMALNLGNIANTYKKLGRYSEALPYYIKAIELERERGNQSGVTRNLFNLGSLYTFMGQYKKSEQTLKEALLLAEELEQENLVMKAEEYLGRLYDSLGNYRLALRYFQKSAAKRDKMLNTEKNRELTRKELGFEFDKKEAAIKAEQDIKDALSREELKRKEIQRNYFIFGFLLVVAFSGIIFREYRLKRKANEIISQQKIEVEKQKHIIEEKNKDITDSINYAQRIQQARLPDRTLIAEAFPQSFVLFKPKDIVSGDFYFFERTKEHFFIAAADCTGHGVPGAFMSLIGSEKLEEAVRIHSDPSLILKELNNSMRKALHQSESIGSTRDGMDISLCAVEIQSRSVRYAGANRPLWIIRKDQTAVEEIKATKTAIGGLTATDQHFESHQVQLGSGDIIYLFTDGYADQFSGVNGKKLMSKRLKEILLEIKDLPMQEQGSYLNTCIQDWRGDIEQVDDILIIGIKV